MTYLPSARCSVDIYTVGGQVSCATVSYAAVTKAISEYWSCEISLDHDYINQLDIDGKTIEIGNTMDVHMGRGTLYRTFSGRVGPIVQTIEGHVPRWTNVEGRGWGEYLNFTYPSGSTKSVSLETGLKWTIKSLTPGTLTTTHVETLGSTVSYTSEGRSAYELILDKANKHDFIFFVDNGTSGIGDVWAFNPGYHTTPEDLGDKLTSLTHKQDPDRIVNYQTVIGAATKTIGSDELWTDNPSTNDIIWTSDGTVDKQSTSAKDPDASSGAGNSVVRAIKSDGSDGIYLECEFLDGAGASSPVDLRRFGSLQYTLYYEFVAESRADTAVSFYIYFKTNDTNYFRVPQEISAADIKRIGYQQGVYTARYGWHKVDTYFNILRKNDPALESYGDPDWGSIAKVQFRVAGPKPLSGVESTLKIDNMQFKGGYYGYTYSDTTSISKYGRREGKLIYDTTLESDSECLGIATNVVTFYKDPLREYTSAVSHDYLNLLPGYEMVVAQQDDISPHTVTIREVKHVFDNMDITTGLELSDKYIPSLEHIHSGFSRDIEHLKNKDLYSNISDYANVRLGPVAYDISDVDRTPTKGGNLILNPSFEISDRYWAPEADVPACWLVSTVPPSADFRRNTMVAEGEYSLYIGDGKTIQSWLFGTSYKLAGDNDKYYLMALKHHPENPAGDVGTLEAQIIWNRLGVGAVSTISMFVPAAGDIWTTAQTITVLPDTINSGILKLISPSGEYVFVDDAWVSELIQGSDILGSSITKTSGTDETAATAWTTVDTHIFVNATTEFHNMRTISFEWKQDPLDSTTHYSRIAIMEDGTTVSTNNYSTSPPDTDYHLVEWVAGFNSKWNSSIDVEFLFYTGNASYPVEYKNLTTKYKSVELEVPYN